MAKLLVLALFGASALGLERSGGWMVKQALAGPADDAATSQGASSINSSIESRRVVLALSYEASSPAGLQRIAALPGVDLQRVMPHLRIASAAVSLAGLAHLSAEPGVIAIEPDLPLRSHLDASTRYIGTDRLRRQGVAGEGARVAVVDTGVDVNHVDLRDAVVDQVCTLQPQDRCGDDDVADDVDGHGTSVAGIVASRGNRSPHGVAPEAEIVAVRMLEERNTGAGSDLLQTLDILSQRDDLDAINLSLGTDPDFEDACDDAGNYARAMARVVERLRAKGVLTVASSGNDGNRSKMGFPACLSGVLSIGAMDIDSRRIADFTNRSRVLDILAPGTGIESPAVGGDTRNFGGTSASAPHVAGAVAILRAEHRWADPALISFVLTDTAQAPSIRIEGRSIGTLKVDSALRALARITPSPTLAPPSATPTLPATSTPSPEPTRRPQPSPTWISDTPVASATAVSEPSATRTSSRWQLWLPRLGRHSSR